MNDSLLDRLPRLFQRKESARRDKAMSVLGEYNLGNIIAFSSEFSEQARDMMQSAGELRAGRIVEAFKKGAPNPNKHHMVPMVSIIRRGDQHFLRYVQEWRNEVGQPDVGLSTAGNEVPITRHRAKEIMRKFSQFNEFELRSTD